MPAAVAIPLITAGIGAGATVAGSAIATHGSTKAADLQAQAAQHAADLEAASAKEALAFQQQQAALAQKHYQDTQAFNRSVYAAQQARLAPYRAYGTGALTQLSHPMAPGSTAPFVPSGTTVR